MRGSTEEALLRDNVARGAIVKANDSTKMQEVDVRLLHDEVHTGIERMQAFGFTSVPLPMDGDGKAAEVVVVFPTGDRSQGIVAGTDDRRFRPKNLKPGESAHHDDQGQISKIGRDGHELTAKTVTITGGGDKPTGDTATQELNEFMKGVRAEIAQIKDSHHALFDAASQLKTNIEQLLPNLIPINTATQITAALNGAPGGLDAMLTRAEAKLQNYFQTAVQQALTSFLDPSRLLNAASVLAGGIEAEIASVQSQISSAIAANPVVAAVDALQAELAALTASASDPAVLQAGIARLQPQIDALTASNSIIGTVSALRATLQGLISTAGDGLHFLAVQQRAAQGLVRSIKFSS